MDDAGQGRRGLRAKPSSELFHVLRERYGLDAEGATDLGGSSNLNLLIAGRWVARVYRPYVTAARLADINRVREAIRAGDVPSAEVIPTGDGEPWTMAGDRLVEVERYVTSDARMNSWERLEDGLPTLGRIHSLLAPVVVGPAGKTPLFVNHVESHEAIEWTSRGADRIRSWRSTAAERRLAALAEELAELVWAAERDAVADTPRQLVHGDFWDNNVLFHRGRLVLVTDFDFMGERPRIDDLALTLYYTNSTFAGDSLSDDRIRVLRRLVDAYESGLDEPLTTNEREALPLAIARQPLWAVGKWLALLDAEEAARGLAAEMASDVLWALALIRDRQRWQTAFA
ncbi:MAG: phosphotransferase [Dehalococcoidia bacterium]